MTDLSTAIRKEIVRVGGTVNECTKGKKHWKIFWTTPAGRKVLAVCAATASDYRAERNALALIRREIRMEGMAQ